jgi:signal recognition particle receptor subunit beta
LSFDIDIITRCVIFFNSNNVRKTRTAALEATDGSTSSAVYLGRRDQNFSFADLRPMRVEFIECSLVGKVGDAGCQIEDVVKWIEKTA